MAIRVCVAGATGWAGRALVAAIADSEDFELVGAVSRTHAGSRLADVLGDPRLSVTVAGSVADALAVPTDVMLDYTRADAVRANVAAALDAGVAVVIGASGLTADDYRAIDEHARRLGIGVAAVGNFAISAALLQKFACEAAMHIGQWEIVDYASAAKIDAPSGTARELASRLAEVRAPSPTVRIEDTIGVREARGATLEGTQVHSVRLPGHTIGVEILFGTGDGRLSIRYDAGSGADAYVDGALIAIRRVRTLIGLVRGLDRLMGESLDE